MRTTTEFSSRHSNLMKRQVRFLDLFSSNSYFSSGYSILSIEQYHVSKSLWDSKQLIIWKDVFLLLQSL